MIKLDENEKLIAIFRKHPFYFVIKILGLALFALAPILLTPLFEIVASFLSPSGGAGNILFWVYFMYLTVLWVIAFVAWTDYYLDIWVLTDKRLIDVEQRGLFSREVSSLRLDRIQDVNIKVVGVLDTFLHIGTVSVQTAGSEKEFIMPSAREPEKMKEKILDAHTKQVEAVQTVRIEQPQNQV